MGNGQSMRGEKSTRVAAADGGPAKKLCLLKVVIEAPMTDGDKDIAERVLNAAYVHSASVERVPQENLSIQAAPRIVQWDSVAASAVGLSGASAASIVGSSADYRSWEFEIWNLTHLDLVELTMKVAIDFELPTKYGLPAAKWTSFLHKIERLMGHRLNPYHNFVHIVDVFQTCSVMLGAMDARLRLPDLEIFALLISALVHDLEHPGMNNLYQINAGTPLAIRYNDASVLENHHCAMAFTVFNEPDSDVLCGLDASSRRAVRKMIITSVLGTDMTFHFAMKDELEECAKRNPPFSRTDAGDVVSSPMLPENDRLLFIKAILHVCDISNPAKPWNTSKRWSDLVLQEFFEQGDREIAEGLPVSMNCNRATTKQDEMSLNFCDFVVAPFFFSLTMILPKAFMACEHLCSNRNAWHSMLEERIRQDDSLDSAQKEDAISKWVAKKDAFAKRATDVINAAKTTVSQMTA